MTHADRIREQERRVVEAVLHEPQSGPFLPREKLPPRIRKAKAALLALRAECCKECDGAGRIANPRYLYGGPDTPLLLGCPAKCENGRIRQ